eukprot:jgi/Chrzof1/8145/UNPLg00192.t1
MFRVTRSTRSLWHVVAAVSGASGVALAAYGAHGFKPSAPYFDECFSRANQQQMYHTCLLAIAPLTSCYAIALTEDRRYGAMAPYG